MSAKKIKLKKKQAPPLVVEQWIEVEVFDGITKSTRYPADADVQKMIDQKVEAQGRPVDLVYRRFNFVHGVPPEYLWTTGDPLKRQFGGHCIQRLRPEDWHDTIAKEDGGHLRGNPYHMPRPEARGGCDCEGCRTMSARIQREGR